MRRLVLALAISLGLTAPFRGSAPADISVAQTNQAILSCNDGHSVVLGVDSTTLASLTADVQAINTSGTGLSCTLNTTPTDPSSETSEWTVYDYNPSNQALAPRNSPNKMPAKTTDGGVSCQFPFNPNIYTALFTTPNPGVTATHTRKTRR